MSHSTPVPNHHYPYQYAESVVDAFVDKYARATNFLAKVSGVSALAYREHLIKLFMVNNQKWNVIRDLIKWVAAPTRFNRLRAMEVEDCQTYLTYVRYECEELVIFDKKSLAAIDNSD